MRNNMKQIIFSILVIGSAATLNAEGNHKGDHGMAHWAAPKAAAARINPIKSDQASINRGKQTFFQSCSSCHGATAMGDGPVGANLNPSPTNLTIMAGNHPDGDFAWKIANGRGPMPAWKTVLNENQIWDLVNYIQALENPNGKGKMVGMDHSKMSMKEMDQSKMGHSTEDDHHKVEEADDHGHDKKHAH